MNFETLKTARENEVNVLHETWVDLRCQAITHGEFKIVRELFGMDNVIRTYLYDGVYINAALSSSTALAMLIWLHANGVYVPERHSDDPAIEAWLHEFYDREIPRENLCESTITTLIIRGDINLLKKLRAHGHPWAVDCIHTAIKYDQLEILKWLIEPRDYVIKGFSLRSNDCDYICDNFEYGENDDHRKMLMWLNQNYNTMVVAGKTTNTRIMCRMDGLLNLAD